MNILILHKAMVMGGIEKNLLTYTTLFKELGYHLDFLFTYELSQKKYHLQDELFKLNSNLHYVFSSQLSNKILTSQTNKRYSLKHKLYYELSRYLVEYKQKAALIRLIKNKNFDLIIDFSGVLDKIISTLNINIPIIRWFQSETDLHHFIKKPKRFSHYTQIIALTKDIQNKLIEQQPLNREKFKLISNPINHHEISQKSSITENIQDQNYLLTVARLVEGKGLFELIDIYAKLKEKGVKNKLYIVGEGELKLALQEKINTLNLAQDCLLLGNKLNPYPYFKNAKLFLFASESEGLGMVILESMCCAVPTVVMDCPTGPKEILGEQSEYGKLIPLHDKEQFVDAVIELLNNDEIYQHYQNQSYLRSLDFSLEKTKQNIQTVFTSIWNSKA